jgi:hypothetical protein
MNPRALVAIVLTAIAALAGAVGIDVPDHEVAGAITDAITAVVAAVSIVWSALHRPAGRHTAQAPRKP